MVPTRRVKSPKESQLLLSFFRQLFLEAADFERHLRSALVPGTVVICMTFELDLLGIVSKFTFDWCCIAEW